MVFAGDPFETQKTEMNSYKKPLEAHSHCPCQVAFQHPLAEHNPCCSDIGYLSVARTFNELSVTPR